jgi:ankyrin repeat protein
MTESSATELSDVELQFLLEAMNLARGGDTSQLSALIDAGLPVNLTNAAGDSLLILAAYRDHPATVQALLERGADTERVNDRGQTALAAAVFRRSAGIVGALLDAGADPGHGSPSAREIATFFNLDAMQELLSSRPDATAASR